MFGDWTDESMGDRFEGINFRLPSLEDIFFIDLAC